MQRVCERHGHCACGSCSFEACMCSSLTLEQSCWRERLVSRAARVQGCRPPSPNITNEHKCRKRRICKGCLVYSHAVKLSLAFQLFLWQEYSTNHKKTARIALVLVFVSFPKCPTFIFNTMPAKSGALFKPMRIQTWSSYTLYNNKKSLDIFLWIHNFPPPVMPRI